MANETRRILIESILGGIGTFSHFSKQDEFLNAVNITPYGVFSSDINDNNSGGTYPPSDYYKASGLIEPIGVANVLNSTSAQIPAFIIPNPKDDNYYVYGRGGSVYSYVISTDFTALSDGGTMSNVTNCGAAYYDNYIYFAKNTTVARYGPLNGTPAFNGDYWVTTLSKTALSDYSGFMPHDYAANDPYPQHIMHRHSDGILYFADMVGGQGYLHTIQTSKTTVEGDTNNGSTYLKLAFGYGLYPTAIESYGSSLVIALWEGPSGGATNPQRGQKAKIAIWDTTSDRYNLITNEEFPDELISAMKNINGVLYIASGNRWYGGFRVSQYVGGYNFKEITRVARGQPPFAGAILGTPDKLIVASEAIYLIGLSGLSRGIFKYFPSFNRNFGLIYCLALEGYTNFRKEVVLGGWYNLGAPTSAGIDIFNPYNITSSAISFTSVPQYWMSQIFKIGQPFKITKIRIPLLQPLTSSMSIIPTIFYDGAQGSKVLTTINSTNFGTATESIVIRPQNLTADHEFYLQLNWTGTTKCVVNLPITIEYELLNVDTAYP